MDPWNPYSGLLEEPRRPVAEAVWKPFAIGSAGAERWSVLLHHATLPWVVEWDVDASGSVIGQNAVGCPEAVAYIHSGLFTGSVGFAEYLLVEGHRSLARKAALSSIRNGQGRLEGLEFLISLYESESRSLAARRLTARLARLRTALRKRTWFEAEAPRRLFELGFGEHRAGVKILYLLQSPHQLMLEMESALTTDQSEFIVLTYKKENFHHRYIFLPGSSWSQGRNLLYDLCLKRFNDYEYYVFCDGDFGFANHSLADGVKAFNAVLLAERPEVATPLNSWHPVWGQHDPSQLRVTPYGFDAMFNAFSRRVLQDGILFPYIECFDHHNWHNSQWLLLMLARIYYLPVQLNDLDVQNDEHGFYPQDASDERQMQRLIRLITSVDEANIDTPSLAAKTLRRSYFNRRLRDKLFEDAILARK